MAKTGTWQQLAVAALLAAGCGDDSEAEDGSVNETGVAGTGINLDDAMPGADETGEKFDAGDGMATAGAGDCPGTDPGGENTFSIIWIANSPEGTVSKIDTNSGMELARYYSGPTDGDDDPSRTAVNLEGDVAVTNRSGSVTKFSSEDSRCVDNNGNGMIDTSTGMGDVLPFGEDECMLWHVTTPSDGNNQHGPRPTAWDAGAANNPCAAADDRLWIGWWDFDADIGRFRRLSGTDGATLDEVEVDAWGSGSGTNFGPYGGAVDASGDLWTVGRNPGPLVRIDGATLVYDRYEVPEGTSPYGMTVDAEGHPWMGGWNGSVLHFDPNTEQWDIIDVPGHSRLRGVMVDRDGQAWVAANNPCGAVQVDVASRTLVQDSIALEGCDDPVGVSIDAEGFVWIPDRGADQAYKLKPSDLSVTITPGLVAPYTYSDMTGAGLGLVVNPPAG